MRKQATGARKVGGFGLDFTNLGLLALLIAQIVVIAIVFWPSASSIADAGELLEIDSMEAITGIEISDSTGNHISFSRSSDGWVLEQSDGFPADATKIEPTLEKLLAIDRLRLVTETEASHRQLQVAEDAYAARVTLRQADGNSVLYVGSSSGPGSTHVRLADEDRTYLTADIASWEISTQASSWIDTSYVSIDTASISTVTIDNANGSFVFTRGSDGVWTLDGATAEESVDSAAVDSLAGRIGAISLMRPLGTEAERAFGLDSPTATVTIVHQDDAGSEVTTTIQVGSALEDESGYYAKSSDSPYYVTIGSSIGDAMINAMRDEFLTEPESSEDASERDVSSEEIQEDAPTSEEIEIEPSQPISP